MVNTKLMFKNDNDYRNFAHYDYEYLKYISRYFSFIRVLNEAFSIVTAVRLLAHCSLSCLLNLIKQNN